MASLLASVALKSGFIALDENVEKERDSLL